MPDIVLFVIGLTLFVAAIWPRPKSPEQVYIAVVRPDEPDPTRGAGCLFAFILVAVAVVVLA